MSYKTLCCNSDYYRVNRGLFRCSQCDKDITIELVFLAQAEEESIRIKQEKKERQNGKFQN
jgi:hypothetical protein